jgi:hypothetical protein
MRQCQKYQKGIWEAFGTSGTPSVSVFGETTRYPHSHTRERITLHSFPLSMLRTFTVSIDY